MGASGNDIIVGGSGDGAMHGGGGHDTFTFCKNWGNDTVVQLNGGTALLWFNDLEKDALVLESDAMGNAVLSDGNNTLTLQGVQFSNELANAFADGNDLMNGISLKFGNDGSVQYSELLTAGAFNDFTSEKIFEDKDRGLLA